jgi:hypothetical protein
MNNSRVAGAKPNSFLKGMKREVSLQSYLKRLSQSTLKVLPILLLIFLLFINVIQVHAATDYFAWDKDLSLYFPDYDSNLYFNDTTYFQTFDWNDPVAYEILFTNIYTNGETTSLSTLNIDPGIANITLMTCNSTYLDFYMDTDETIYLTLPSRPATIMLDGVEGAPTPTAYTGLTWTWTPALNLLTLILNTGSPFSNEITLIWLWTETPSNLGFILGAFALTIAIIAVSFVIIKKREPED